MNSENDKRWEQALDRALRSLPEIAAPRTLIPRVKSEIQRRATLPWYRQAWQMWPMPLRVASLSFLILCFGTLSLAAWQLTQLEGVAALGRELSKLFAGVTAIINTMSVLLNAAVLVVKKLGTGWILACLFVIALGYATCLGLGSMCVRLAMARR